MLQNKQRKMRDVNRLYDAKITLQKKKESVGHTESLDAYEDYTTIWAESRFLKGRNLYSARAVNIRTDVEFVVRCGPEINEDMRIIYNEKPFEIEAILPLENDRLYRIIRAYEIKRDM